MKETFAGEKINNPEIFLIEKKMIGEYGIRMKIR